MKNKDILAGFGVVALAALLEKLKSNNDSEQFSLIIQKLDLIMATKQEQFDAIIAKLDGVTNDIAADYKQLLDEVQAGTVSQESLDKASVNVAKLEALGASVSNPVPETPTEPTDPVEPVEGEPIV